MKQNIEYETNKSMKQNNIYIEIKIIFKLVIIIFYLIDFFGQISDKIKLIMSIQIPFIDISCCNRR